MPYSSPKLMKTRSDNPTVVQFDTGNSLNSKRRSNNEVKNSIRVRSTCVSDDESKIRRDESFETSERKSISREVDLGPVLDKIKRGNGELKRESWMERDTSGFIGDITEAQEAYFVTGSSYEGSWDALGMAGVGRYVMPHGTTYEGEIRDGMFHGEGSLYWSENQRLDTIHIRGEMRKHRYTFHDGLVYEEENWNYCKFPDRRFYECVKKGLRPGGRTLKTGRQPSKVLPFGCYDTGDGVFDPKTLRITSFDDSKKVLRLPLKEECEWILKNCRKSWTEPTGYRPELNENWSDVPTELPYNLPMSQDSPDPWWKRLTTFARDDDFMAGQGYKDVFSDHGESCLSPEVCLCGKYVIIGEPCHCMSISVTPEAEGYELSEERLSEDMAEHYENYEGKHVFSSQETTSREKLEKIRVTKKTNKMQSAVKIPTIDLNSSSSFSEEFSEDSLTDESSKNFREKRQRSKDVIKDTRMTRKTRRSEQEKGESEGEEILRKKSQDMDERIENLVEGKSLEKADKEKEVKFTKSIDQSLEKLHEKHYDVDVMENEVPEKIAEESDDEKIERQDDAIGGLIQRKTGENSRKEIVDLSEEIEEEVWNENSGEISEDITKAKEKFDYTTDTIPGEKVTRPEESEMITSETKLLSKNLSQKSHRSHSSIEKISHGDLSNDHRANENNDKIVEFSMDEYRLKTDDIIITETLSIEKILRESDKSKSEDHESINFDIGNLSHKMEKKIFKRDDESSVDDKIEIVHESSDVIGKIESKGDSQLDVPKDDKSITESEKKLKISSESKTKTPEDYFVPSSLGEKGSQISELTYAHQSSRVSNLIVKEKSSSTGRKGYEKEATAESFVSMIDDLESLDKVHPSLESLVSTSQKLPKEKEIIEIYSKFSSKGKPKMEPMNANVWRLSGVNQAYSSKTKIEDLLFHPALTAPRSENIEYVRKPCDFRVCKSTIREVRPNASRSRKEYPSSVSKSFQSSVHRNLNEKK